MCEAKETFAGVTPLGRVRIDQDHSRPLWAMPHRLCEGCEKRSDEAERSNPERAATTGLLPVSLTLTVAMTPIRNAGDPDQS